MTKKPNRDREGRIINYSSDDSDEVKIEVQITRFEGRLERIESKQEGLREETKEVHGKVDRILRDTSTMTSYYREVLDKQNELKNDIHCKPDGLVCRVEKNERGLSSIFGGIKVLVWVAGILLSLAGAIYALIKIVEVAK
jgi:uncharacterized protein YoxC